VRARYYVDIDPAKIGREIDGAPVLAYTELARAAPVFVLVCIRSHDASELIREKLSGLGFREHKDYLFVG
jgi:hypothetical protein